MFTSNPIKAYKVTPDKEKLYLIGIKDIIPQWKLILWVEAEDRIDVPTWPVGRDPGNTGTYHFGTDSIFAYHFIKIDSNVEHFKRPWTVRPEVIYDVTGIWTVPVYVNTIRRKNVTMYMTPDVMKDYIPYGYTLAFIPAERNYSGNYWTILRTSDYKLYKDYLVVRESMGV